MLFLVWTNCPKKISLLLIEPERFKDFYLSLSLLQQFTGLDGKYVPLSETIRGFKEILEGKHDDVPESYFLNAGTIDEVVARKR